MRYFMTLHMKGYQKYGRSKLKNQLLLSKFRLFKFDLSYFLDMVKMGPRGFSCGSTFSNCQDILKIENILHKQGLVETQFLRTVQFQ